ncbi:MAG TPA: homoserine dehydrogenase [Candidatus Omnitrophota bacterium]|nr:homoserine dehydrogenase [Candidatus Omnitrophota bacterium]HPS37723.1 homoserine dehydrogenase [Candidatus Omnitrophota bacterium]
MKKMKIGLLGLGQIGGGLYEILSAKKALFARQLGVSFEITRIAEKFPNAKRKVHPPKRLMTKDAFSVVRDPSIDVVVELIGGTTIARALIKEALKNGKHVVTANKALLAEYGDEIFELAHRKRRWICFEASVGGGIPCIKALREGLAANRIDSIHAIINGTTNYILTQMTSHGTNFAEALAGAQQQGYAEANPFLDISGNDAAHKLAILARFAFGGKVTFKDIYCEGISRISSDDIAFAKEFGYTIKLLAIAKKSGGGMEARVQPTLLPNSHILANVGGSFNAILMHGDEVGDVLFYGRGAGPHPTASAVIADLIDIAKAGVDGPAEDRFVVRALGKKVPVKNISSILSRYYLRFNVIDKPSVVAGISRILGQYGISISDVMQRERSAGQVVPLILLTHDTHEKELRTAVRAIDRLPCIKGRTQVIRIEGA